MTTYIHTYAYAYTHARHYDLTYSIDQSRKGAEDQESYQEGKIRTSYAHIFPTSMMPSLILYCFVFGLSISSLGAAFVPIPARRPTSQQKQSARSCSLTPVTPAQRSPPPPLLALHMFHGPEANDGGRQFAASVLASTCVLTGILTSSTAALAMTTNHNMPIPETATTPTLTLSARSGGGTGGRSASSSSIPAFRPPSRLPGSATSRQYGQAVIIRPSPVLSSGFGLVDLSPFGYGLSSYGASGAASVINENIREARQEGELRDERIELATVRQREAKSGQRMKLLGQQQQQRK